MFRNALCGLALAAATGTSAVAGDAIWSVAPDPPEYTYEAWAGGDATGHSWTIYAGSTTGLMSDVRGNGFKLRGAAGYGAYTYASPRWDGRRKSLVAFDGVHTYGDVFLGYQHR